MTSVFMRLAVVVLVTALAVPSVGFAAEPEPQDATVHAQAGTAAVQGPVEFEGITRIAGANRFDTAARVAKASFPGWTDVEHVVLTCGDDRAAVDSLSASGLVWLYDAPLLTTSTGFSPAALKTALAEIVSENTSVTVHVVGGPASVPQARLAEVAAIVGEGKVERLPYGDRFETARQVCVRMLAEAPARGKTVPKTMLAARGHDPRRFVDALALSTITARTGAPLLLFADSVPVSTRRALDDLQPTSVIIGGGGSLGAIAGQFKGVDTPIAIVPAQWWGTSRYATARVIAEYSDYHGWLDKQRVVMASSLADALTGGAMFGRKGYVLLLAAPSSIPYDTAYALGGGQSNPAHVYLLGGLSAVNATAWNDLRMLVDPSVPMVQRLGSVSVGAYKTRDENPTFPLNSGYRWYGWTKAVDQYGFVLQGASATVKTTLSTCQQSRMGPVYSTSTLTDTGLTNEWAGEYCGMERLTTDFVLYNKSSLVNTTKATVTFKGVTLTKSTTWKF